ncbi:hypothetical protein PIB30_029049 [Stylosanthes scabra]|uniref:NADP-dependent oxidoreductase domain-containing protein n=1 Tax=Stylosanthes scabra TaxID=79078 RepID=A0ABU6QBI0_9FABA|nr:hypothetical protein [Stylosanthes scabra]
MGGRKCKMRHFRVCLPFYRRRPYSGLSGPGIAIPDSVEMNAAWRQDKLREFCKEKGIYVAAWSPLGANGALWGSLAVMESPILKDIATNTGNTIAQVALRWIIEQGAIPIVRSFNKERMKQNLKIFDWKLSESDLEKIKEIPQFRAFGGERFVADHGPYKTIDQLWD